jgi:putative ABC transport system substrate-binding protein
LGIEVSGIAASSSDELDGVLSAVTAANVNGLVVTDDPLFVAAQQRLVDFATKRRLPAVYALRELVDSGGLISYSSSIFDIWRRAGGYVDRILKGANPADMPIEQPVVFELRVNLRAARAIGLTIPLSLLVRADDVIE